MTTPVHTRTHMAHTPSSLSPQLNISPFSFSLHLHNCPFHLPTCSLLAPVVSPLSFFLSSHLSVLSFSHSQSVCLSVCLKTHVFGCRQIMHKNTCVRTHEPSNTCPPANAQKRLNRRLSAHIHTHGAEKSASVHSLLSETMPDPPRDTQQIFDAVYVRMRVGFSLGMCNKRRLHLAARARYQRTLSPCVLSRVLSLPLLSLRFLVLPLGRLVAHTQPHTHTHTHTHTHSAEKSSPLRTHSGSLCKTLPEPPEATHQILTAQYLSSLSLPLYSVRAH